MNAVERRMSAVDRRKTAARQANSTTGSGQRFEVLDGMRGVAAFSVMVHHFTMLYSHAAVMKDASLAVDYFFILGGFVIAHSYSKRLLGGMTLVQFMKRRFVRLYPMFILGLWLGIPGLVIMTSLGQSDYSTHDIISSVIYNSFFIPYLNDGTLFYPQVPETIHAPLFLSNGALWNVFFQLFINLFCVFLYKASRSTLIRIMAISFILIVVYGAMMAYGDHQWAIGYGAGWGTFNFLGGFPRVFFGFTMGTFLYFFVDDRKAKPLLKNAGIVTKNPLLLYVLMFSLFLFPYTIKGLFYLFATAVIAPCLVLLGSRTTCRTGIEINVSKFLGWISFPLYCLHYPIGQIVYLINQKYGFVEPMGFQVVGIAMVVALAASALAAKFYDVQVRRYLSRKLIK